MSASQLLARESQHVEADIFDAETGFVYETNFAAGSEICVHKKTPA